MSEENAILKLILLVRFACGTRDVGQLKHHFDIGGELPRGAVGENVAECDRVKMGGGKHGEKVEGYRPKC
jgi:hypothetical protein